MDTESEHFNTSSHLTTEWAGMKADDDAMISILQDTNVCECHIATQSKLLLLTQGHRCISDHCNLGVSMMMFVPDAIFEE